VPVGGRHMSLIGFLEKFKIERTTEKYQIFENVFCHDCYKMLKYKAS
jgi:hypothetical protein